MGRGRVRTDRGPLSLPPHQPHPQLAQGSGHQRRRPAGPHLHRGQQKIRQIPPEHQVRHDPAGHLPAGGDPHLARRAHRGRAGRPAQVGPRLPRVSVSLSLSLSHCQMEQGKPELQEASSPGV